MDQRHRLHALQKKLRDRRDIKAKRIKKFNLGCQKLNQTTKRTKATLECEINTGINQLLRSKNPSLLITEDLRHVFTFSAPKSINRKFSFWARGKIQDRIAFKALAEGFRHEQVNPAYGSQTCPHCDYVDSKNRNRDYFKCLHCRYEDQSDRVAALNYARRYDDCEIDRYTPYRQVKIILLSRFHRRLEAEQSATVQGRTLDTVTCASSPRMIEI